ATRTVVLSNAYWRRWYGGRRSVIGRTLVADGQAREIIGVLPAGFRFLDYGPRGLWLPLRFDRAHVYLGNFSYDSIARLKPGATLAMARADQARMEQIVLRRYPAPPGYSKQLFYNAHIGPIVQPLRREVVGDVSTVLWILLGGMGLVLLIACANVANLTLVRAEGRQQELAIRAALGGGRRQLAGELLLESVVLGLAGGVLGLGLAYAGLRLLLWLAPSGLPRLDNIGLHPWVLLFCFGAALLAGALAGLLPALRYSRATGALREGGRSLSTSRQRHRARNILVMAQVALAFVLLICAGLMIRSFAALRHVNPGFRDPASLQTFGLYLPPSDIKDNAAVPRADAALLQRLAALPGVSAVAMASTLPLTGQNNVNPVVAADHHYAANTVPPLRDFNFVSPGYFHVMGIPLMAGRDFTWADNLDRRDVAVISENFAKEYWGGPAAALGHRIRSGSDDAWRQIIGVVGDVRAQGLDHTADSDVYWPLEMAQFMGDKVHVQRYEHVVLRTPQAGSSALLAEARSVVSGVDPNAPLISPRTMAHFYRRALARTSFTLVMLAIAGVMALLLGAIGLYGVLAYTVSQRRREIGIRLALGQEPKSVVGMILRQGLRLAAVGIGLGIVLALGAARLLASLLFGVRPMDALTYLAIIAALGATAALASLGPARRAAGVDPAEALRAE
ncbi:MAG: ADOP family duplicated permease, partial [Terriglobales bacterium]